MSSDFEGQFDEFARSHASAFMPAVDMKLGDEHPMELYACYEEYLSHFEGKVRENLWAGAGGEGGGGGRGVEILFAMFQP